jgi:hypothetical protein
MFTMIIVLQLKYGIVSDNSTSTIKKSYSYSRVQLAWWTLILLSAIIAIIFKTHNLPQLWQSTLVLLGIGSLTTASGRIIDISDDSSAAVAQNKAAAQAVNPAEAPPVKTPSPHRNEDGQNFFLDILSDKNGLSIHRFQAVALNFVIGLWFIYKVFENINNQTNSNNIIPDIDQNNLILLGLSAGTYVVLKSGENK